MLFVLCLAQLYALKSVLVEPRLRIKSDDVHLCIASSSENTLPTS